jgi:molybdopterin-guanine dinucleotide biosynthesis protein B
LICALVRRFVASGARVAAIKHTHHDLNEGRGGDTGQFLDAGAEPVILAGNDEAVVFTRTGITRVPFSDPRELLPEADFVLVEGFKHYKGWLRIGVYRFTG